MSDNPLEPNPTDNDRININVESEIVYWTRELGVTRAQLSHAIELAGPGIGDIRRFLRSEGAA